MNRGARRADVFRTDDDCAAFLTLVDDGAPRFQVDVHAFALMPNHFHLLVVSQGGRLSDFMAFVLGGYARYVNARGGWDGPVWRGRFKSVQVHDDAFWDYLVAYIHLNPVRAGLVDGPAFARWTSLDSYVHGLRPLRCLHTDLVLQGYGGLAPMLRYMDDVQRKRVRLPEGYREDDLWKVPRHQPRRAPPPPPPAARTAEQALAEVCEVTGVSRDRLFHSRRGVPNPAAWLAAWWLQEAAGQTQREVARLMGVAQPGVAQRGRLLRAHADQPPLVTWMAALRARR